MALSFRTDRSGQTKQTQMRLLEQSGQGLNYLRHFEFGKLLIYRLVGNCGHRYSKHRACWRRFLAHLSQRLIGELIGYPWSGVRPSSGIRRPSSTISNLFFSETARPIKAKFYVEPPWVGGTIFCSRHLGHMTKMAATPIYGKNPSKIFFSRTGRPIFTKLGM